MKKRYLPAFLPALIGSALLTGCARYASVSERPAIFQPPVGAQGPVQAAASRIEGALRRERTDPAAAIGDYLSAAHAAAEAFGRNPDDTAARDSYNFAVARIVATLRRSQTSLVKGPLQTPAEHGGYTLSLKRDPRPQWNPDLYTFVPADEFDVRGKYVDQRISRAGLGAPLVAIGVDKNRNARAVYGLTRTFYGVTAVIRFSGRTAVLALEDPLDKEEIRFERHTYPLAADFTVPLAVMLASTNTAQSEIPRMLRPAKFEETARITRLQPYDPKKTVVLVIHGLMDSPATWTPMLNALRGDPGIRKNYQFWFFSYPSGYPYPYSAAILRRELDGIQKVFPVKKPIIVIGHSMGGCIARLLITDSGDRLWAGVFNRPPAETVLPPQSRKLLAESLIFRHRPEVGRVIMISAPLRGSDLARNPLGRFGSMMVKAPSALVETGRDALQIISFHSDDLRLKRIPNSVDTLAPNNRFVKAINTVPIRADIPCHVIAGDRGLGGNKDKTRPEMSDGVVPYWSSHLDRAQSELIVPSNHGAHQNPQAIREVGRILRLHAADRQAERL